MCQSIWISSQVCSVTEDYLGSILRDMNICILLITVKYKYIYIFKQKCWQKPWLSIVCIKMASCSSVSASTFRVLNCACICSNSCFCFVNVSIFCCNKSIQQHLYISFQILFNILISTMTPILSQQCYMLTVLCRL